MKVTVVCPSRGRPELAARLLRSVRATSDADCLFYLDEDDPSDYDVPAIRGPRVYNNGSANALGRHVGQASDYIVLAGDDSEFVTEGWDKLMIDRVPPDVGAIIGFARRESEPLDFGQGAPRAQHFALTRAWYGALGHVFRDGFRHYRSDHHMARMSWDIGRFVWMPQIVLSHDRNLEIWDDTSRDFTQFKYLDKNFFRSLDWPTELEHYTDLLKATKLPELGPEERAWRSRGVEQSFLTAKASS